MLAKILFCKYSSKKIQDSYSGWGYAPGPTTEMLASLVVTRAICPTWREEVSVPNLV